MRPSASICITWPRRKKPLSLPIVTHDASQPQKDSDDENFHDANDQVRANLLHVVPVKYRSTAATIYDYLSSPHSQRVIQWNDLGVVTVKGAVIPHSNIVDYVSDLCRERKTFHPTGWETFGSALAELTIPEDLIKNTRYLALIQQQRGHGLKHHPAKRPAVARHDAAQKGKKKSRRAVPFIKWQAWRP